MGWDAGDHEGRLWWLLGLILTVREGYTALPNGQQGCVDGDVCLRSTEGDQHNSKKLNEVVHHLLLTSDVLNRRPHCGWHTEANAIDLYGT